MSTDAPPPQTLQPPHLPQPMSVPMAGPGRDRRVLLVHDTFVRRVDARRAGLLCLVTLGAAGAIRHHRLNDELRRLGRVRGAMPFPFIPCNPGMATTTWCFGVPLWLLGAALIIDTLVDPLLPGGSFSVDMISIVASSLLLFTPLWLTALHTARRIRTAQQLVGVDPRALIRPMPAAALACCCFAIFTWHAQRAADRAWATWADDQPDPPNAPMPIARPTSWEGSRA